jgi:hypothetical protein
MTIRNAKDDFIRNLRDTYGEAVKERMIPLPDSIHVSMKQAAARQSRPLYEVYTEAARQWLKSEKPSAKHSQKMPAMSAEQEVLVSDILDLYRNRKTSRTAQETLNAIRLLVRSAQARV